MNRKQRRRVTSNVRRWKPGMVATTNQQLLESVPALSQIAALRLKAVAAQRLYRVLREVEAWRTDYNSAATPLQARLKEMEAKKDSAAVAELQKEKADLLAGEVKLNIEPLPLDILGDNDISAGTLLALDWLFTIESASESDTS